MCETDLRPNTIFPASEESGQKSGGHLTPNPVTASKERHCHASPDLTLFITILFFALPVKFNQSKHFAV
jgi:hypothetical protein